MASYLKPWPNLLAGYMQLVEQGRLDTAPVAAGPQTWGDEVESAQGESAQGESALGNGGVAAGVPVPGDEDEGGPEALSLAEAAPAVVDARQQTPSRASSSPPLADGLELDASSGELGASVQPLMEQLASGWQDYSALSKSVHALCTRPDRVVDRADTIREPFLRAWESSLFLVSGRDVLAWSRSHEPSMTMISGTAYRLTVSVDNDLPLLLNQLSAALREAALPTDVIDALEGQRGQVSAALVALELDPVLTEHRAQHEQALEEAREDERKDALFDELMVLAEATQREGFTDIEAQVYGRQLGRRLMEADLDGEAIRALFERVRQQDPAALDHLLFNGRTVQLLLENGIKGFDGKTEAGEDLYVASGEGFHSGFIRAVREKDLKLQVNAQFGPMMVAGYQVGVAKGAFSAIRDALYDLIFSIPELVHPIPMPSASTPERPSATSPSRSSPCSWASARSPRRPRERPSPRRSRGASPP